MNAFGEVEAQQSLQDSHHILMSIREGDNSVVGRMAESLRPYLREVVRSELKSVGGAEFPDDASDMVQQSLLKAVENLASFRGVSLIEWRVWLATIAKNEVRACSRYWRQSKRSRDKIVELATCEPLPSREDTPSTEVKRRELSIQLADALALLTEPQREIIRWRQTEGLSHAQVAERLGITVDAARQRCKGAMDALRSAFKKMN